MVPTPLVLLAAAAVGVDTGWTKLDSGGYEYIIQISPEQLESLRSGGEFGSDLPSDTGAIRSYKIVVGNGPLLNQGVPLPRDARVNFKPPLGQTPAANGDKDKKKVETKKAQAGGTRGQEDSVNRWRGGAGAQEPPNEAGQVADDVENLINRPKAFADRENQQAPNTRPRSTQLFAAGKGVDGGTDGQGNGAAQSASENADDRSTTSRDDDTGADAPATEEVEPASSESKFWITFLVLLSFLLGSLNGWFGFLAWDFRNRYLELLRDLDTQSNPAEELSERYEAEREIEEEVAAKGDPRRGGHGAMAYAGRKEARRRDEVEYDEE